MFDTDPLEKNRAFVYDGIHSLLHKYSDLLENCHREEERDSYKYLCFFFFPLEQILLLVFTLTNASRVSYFVF